MIQSDSRSTHCVLLAVSVAVATFSCLPAAADTKPQSAADAMKEIQESTRLMGCENAGLSATNIMLLRQMGQRPRAIKQAVIPMDGVDVDDVIADAYTAPKAGSPASMDRVAVDFGNKYEAACLARK